MHLKRAIQRRGRFDVSRHPRIQLTLERLERRDVPSFVAAPIYDSVLTYYIAAGELTGDGTDDAVIGHVIGQNIEILHGNGDGSFAGGATYHVSDNIHGVIVADASGDGILDIITNHLHTDRVRVLIGNGDGTFQKPIAYAAGDWPGTPVAGDFDHDGDLDLAVHSGNNNRGLVNVLINAGGGVFESPVSYQDDSVLPLQDIQMEDLNADGNLDLAALDLFGDFLVMLGNGDGTFTVSRHKNSAMVPPEAMAAGDLDGDGDIDLAIATASSVKLVRGNGDGTFSSVASSVAVPADPYDIIAADTDGDGDVDLFLTDENEVFLLRNQGGAFGQQQRHSGLAIDAAVGDFNNDQSIDFVAAGAEVVTTFLNVGGGLLSAPTFAGSGKITPTDLNGDGDIDFALTSQSSILTGSGGVQFTSGPSIPTGNLFFGAGVATAVETPDLDGDGDLDAVVQLSNTGPYPLGLWKNNGNATFPADSPSYALCTDVSPEFGTVGDINNDGNLDMIAVAGGSVCSFRGNGNGTLQNPNSFSTGTKLTGVVTAYVNDDNNLDLLVTDSVGKGTVKYLRGLGNGTFAFGGSFAVGANPKGLRVADFDGDGDTDVAVANSGSRNVSLLLGNNDGTFAPAINSSVGGNGSRNLAIGDFNIDGRLDLAVANILSHNVSILFGNEDGTFSPPAIYATSLAPKDVELADLNGDGFVDLALTSDAEAAVDLLFGNGDGAFTASVLPAPSQGHNLEIADFDLDGIFDIAVANPFASVGLFRGNGDGTFKFVVPYVAGSSPVDVSAADMNNDGRLDLAVTNILISSVRVVLNTPNGFAATQLVNIVKPTAMRFGDFDGDGDIDMATSAIDGLRVRLNEGNGTFTPFIYYPMAGAGPLLMADFNEDGTPDLALGHEPGAGNNTVTVWLGNGDGTFLATAAFAARFTPDKLLVGDFNGDDVPDIAATQLASHVKIALGNGDGTFRVAPRTTVVGNNDIVSGDFNGDGKTDLATTAEIDSHLHFLYVLLGKGHGTFLPAIPYIFDSYYTNDPTWLTTGDFDRDGWLDIAVSGQKIGIFRNAADWAPLPITDHRQSSGGMAKPPHEYVAFRPHTIELSTTFRNGVDLPGNPVDGAAPNALTSDRITHPDSEKRTDIKPRFAPNVRVNRAAAQLRHLSNTIPVLPPQDHVIDSQL